MNRVVDFVIPCAMTAGPLMVDSRSLDRDSVRVCQVRHGVEGRRRSLLVKQRLTADSGFLRGCVLSHWGHQPRYG